MASSIDQPASIRDHAAENLRFIREAMERAGSVTVIPGAGIVFIGITAIGAAWIASRQIRPEIWLGVWMIELMVAIAADTVATVRKARRTGVALLGTPFRRFLFSFSVPMFVGGLLTLVFHRHELYSSMPALWLLLYGTAIVNGGLFSIRIVPVMGLSFIALGIVAAVSPSIDGDIFMAAGFGVLHIVFGSIIARRHGG